MPLLPSITKLFLLLCLCFSTSLFSQITLRQTTGHNDSKLWMGFQYQHDFSKSFEFQVNVQTRLEQHFTLLDKNLIELEFTYRPAQFKVWKLFGVGGGFRFFGANDIRGKIQGHKLGYRLYGLLTFDKKWKRLELGYRFLYQNQQIIPRYKEGEEEWELEQVLRNRITLSYNFRKWKLDPEIRAEIFYPLDQSEHQGFNGLRLGLGTSYKINKHHILKFRFLYEQSLGLEYTQRDFILVLLYKYKTRYKKKKK